ncbi:MAG: sporulation protein YabP [Clostridia bacterium]|nr:sporulation protein YabP [Clostridia bacterium]
MNIEEKKNISQKNNNVIQNLILESREKLNISGVIDVLSFDDTLVIVQTHLGILTIKGEDLRISKLNTDSEEVIVVGEISTMSYSDKSLDKKENSFLGKIFK